MAISVVQSVPLALTNATNTPTATLTTPPVSGNTLVMFLGVNKNITITSLTQTGVTWTKQQQITRVAENLDWELWTGVVGPGASATMQFTMGGWELWSGVVQELSGVAGIDNMAAFYDNYDQTANDPSATGYVNLLTNYLNDYVLFGTLAGVAISNPPTNTNYTALTVGTTSNNAVCAHQVSGGAAQTTAYVMPSISNSCNFGIAFYATGATENAPQIASVSPVHSPPAGGVTVVIDGAAFAGATAVKFGTVAAASFNVVNTYQITAVAPAHASGAVDIQVTGPGGTSVAVPAIPPGAGTLFGFDPVPVNLLFGIYCGAGGPPATGAGISQQRFTRFAQMVGITPGAHSDYEMGDTWAHIENPTFLADWTDGKRLLLGVSMGPDSSWSPHGGNTSASLAAGAAGTNNAHYTTLGQNLVAMGFANAILRIGWEMADLPWQPVVAGDLPNYATYFQNIVTSLRGVAGQHFLFDWCLNLGPTFYWNNTSLRFNEFAAYPGDNYVDIISFDIYDQTWDGSVFSPSGVPGNSAVDQFGVNQSQDLWNLTYSGYGAETGYYGDTNQDVINWLTMARQHGKYSAVPEWGVLFRSDGHGLGDDPIFIENMHAMLTDPANFMYYHSYYCFNDGTDNADITN